MSKQTEKFESILRVVRGTLRNNGYQGAVTATDAFECLDGLSSKPNSTAGEFWLKASDRTIKSFGKYVNEVSNAK